MPSPSRFNDDLLLTPMLARRFGDEAIHSGGDGRFWGLRRGTSGREMPLANGPAACAEQQMFARDMLRALNTHLHHDGSWVIVFTNPPRIFDLSANLIGAGVAYGRWVILWLDPDGDVQFPIENQQPFWQCLQAGPDTWLEQCETGWQTWHQMMRKVLRPTPEQLIKRAQGQQAKGAFTVI